MNFVTTKPYRSRNTSIGSDLLSDVESLEITTCKFSEKIENIGDDKWENRISNEENNTKNICFM